MFLLNSCLDLFSAACSRRRPFSRSYGVILPSSLTMLLPSASGSSPFLPVSVCGTGLSYTIAAFPGIRSACFPTVISVHVAPPLYAPAFPGAQLLRLYGSFHSPAHASRMRPCSSDKIKYRNFNLLSIGYGFRPHLRSRLPQSRSALLWKPWVFGRKDSHLPLATHSGILSSMLSTAPFGTASSCIQCSSTTLSSP